MGIIEHAIKLVNDKQLAYYPIYSQGLVEVKTLKSYIKTNLANVFNQFSNSLAQALIFFVQNVDRSFYLCVNYSALNNLTLKNPYLLPLIDK